MTNEKNELWNEILEITKERYLPQQPNEMTTRQFAEKLSMDLGKKVTRRHAHDILQELVEDGELNCRKLGQINLYSPVV